MKLKYIIFLTLLIMSCQSVPESNEEPAFPDVMAETWEAHGGLEKWQGYGLMEFTIGDGPDAETHRVNLKNRKVLIESDSFTLGMDGERIWVKPSLDAFERDARFYHNLMFYFAAIPFVFSDPGVNISDAGMRTLDGTEYQAISVSFEEGTGDADDDEYIMLVNPQTHRLEWLLYTVTYFSGEKADSYNALHYQDYRDVNGLMLVGKLSGYRYANDTTGAQRYENEITNQKLSPDQLPDSLFEKPVNAQYWEDQ